MEKSGVKFVDGRAESITVRRAAGEGGDGPAVEIVSRGGEEVVGLDLVLFTGGRDCNSEHLGCEELGIEIGKYGRILVDDRCGGATAINMLYSAVFMRVPHCVYRIAC